MVNGMFLLRLGQHSGTQLVLSVWHKTECKHFKIFQVKVCVCMCACMYVYMCVTAISQHWKMKCSKLISTLLILETQFSLHLCLALQEKGFSLTHHTFFTSVTGLITHYKQTSLPKSPFHLSVPYE